MMKTTRKTWDDSERRRIGWEMRDVGPQAQPAEAGFVVASPRSLIIIPINPKNTKEIATVPQPALDLILARLTLNASLQPPSPPQGPYYTSSWTASYLIPMLALWPLGLCSVVDMTLLKACWRTRMIAPSTLFRGSVSRSVAVDTTLLKTYRRIWILLEVTRSYSYILPEEPPPSLWASSDDLLISFTHDPKGEDAN
ncbi:hypothetical protein ONZ45_g10015 [Pleurotus djamor]|nr:hypothetical protein ONZ45_g10015 [Pleurotus djamor]